MKQVHIPASIEEAQERLGGIGRLLTAKGWERAAIVYAFTSNQQGSNQHSRKTANALGIREFANLGISGLRDDETVAWVRQAWQDAVDDGAATKAEPGTDVTMPDRDFPKHPRTRSAVDGFRAQLRQSPEAVRELVRDQPDIAIELAEQVMATPSVRTPVERALSERPLEREVVQSAPRRRDYSSDFRHAVNVLIPVLHAIRGGTWEPDETERLLAAFLTRAFAEISSGEPSADLFAEIDAFLASQEARS